MHRCTSDIMGDSNGLCMLVAECVAPQKSAFAISDVATDRDVPAQCCVVLTDSPRSIRGA